jgi:hypothetical protein
MQIWHINTKRSLLSNLLLNFKVPSHHVMDLYTELEDGALRSLNIGFS